MDAELKKTINDHYQKGNSIQAIARSYRLTVEEVLDMIGQGEMKSVTIQGDMIDLEEAGPGAQIVTEKTFNVPYTTN